MSETSRSEEIVILLGAGASVNAGVPDTFTMVEKFQERVKDNVQSYNLLHRVIDTLQNYLRKNNKQADRVDVEFLLEALEKLGNRETDVILDFFRSNEYLLEGHDVSLLTDQLKEFIKDVAIVGEDKVDYLNPMLSFINTHYPVNIFSLNYDTCIEQFCNLYKKDYVDGFDVHWNPDLFDIDRPDIRLYKLHGSVMWYRTNKGNYVKLIVSPRGNKVNLITGEEAESLMLYPMRKFDYYEPLIELLLLFKKKLEKAKVVIVVGYSFRDKHIKQIFWDAANRNKELVVFLISPNAFQIYLEQLRFYDPDSPNVIQSPLDGRVIPLSYRFEKVFPLLHNSYLQKLQEGLAKEEINYNGLHSGEEVNWHQLLPLLVDSEYLSRAERIIHDHIQWDGLVRQQWVLALEVSFKALLSALTSGDSKAIQTWKDYFSKVCETFSVEKIDVVLQKKVIELKFNIHDELMEASVLRAHLDKLDSFIEQKKRIVNDDKLAILDAIKLKLRRFAEYLSEFTGQKMRYERYYTLRKDNSVVNDIEEKTNAFVKRSLADTEFKSLVLDIEKTKLEEVFDGKKFTLEV